MKKFNKTQIMIINEINENGVFIIQPNFDNRKNTYKAIERLEQMGIVKTEIKWHDDGDCSSDKIFVTKIER